jgi:hypothetical protein
MNIVKRVVWWVSAGVTYAALMFIALRFFLGFDVTRGQLLFASLVVLGSIAGITIYLIKISIPVIISWLSAIRNAFRTSSTNAERNAWWQTLFDDRMQRRISHITAIAVLAISAMYDPVWSYAQANARAVITVLYITDRQSARLR